jgi:hypothetical protein
MTALLPAELAWYATGRFYEAEDKSLADYGYFLHLPFPGVRMFDGAPGETTAHFTFAAQPFKASGVSNGTLSLGLDPVGEFSLYLQRRPAGTFDDPASFAKGECIATFRRTSLVVGTTVGITANVAIGGATTVPLVGTHVFSARLIASTRFEFGGRQHDSPSMSATASPSSAPRPRRLSCRRRRATPWCCRSPARPSPWVEQRLLER